MYMTLVRKRMFFVVFLTAERRRNSSGIERDTRSLMTAKNSHQSARDGATTQAGGKE